MLGVTQRALVAGQSHRGSHARKRHARDQRDDDGRNSAEQRHSGTTHGGRRKAGAAAGLVEEDRTAPLVLAHVASRGQAPPALVRRDNTGRSVAS